MTRRATQASTAGGSGGPPPQASTAGGSGGPPPRASTAGGSGGPPPRASTGREASERIDELLAELASAPSPHGELATELVRLLVGLYGDGLARIVNLLGERGEAGAAILAALADDPVVEGLLLVHDLHPLDTDARARRGMDRVRPQLGPRAGRVRYLGVTDGVARLELDGDGIGCPSSAQAVRQVIARAVMDAAPEVTDVVVEGLERPSRPALLQIGRRPASTPATTITLATDTTPTTATARPAPSATPSRAPWWGHSTSKGPAMGSRCELCVTEIPAEHGHVADLDQSRLACACRACYLLFTRPAAAHGRYRAVPRRYLADPAHPLSADELDELEIPVGLAFFLRSSRHGDVAGFYPGPAGVTECQLDLAAWERIAAAHPLLTEAEPDVEAILISHKESATECFCVPIDACYELAGRLRLLWRGLDGGPAARDAVAGLLDEVRANAAPLGLAT